jgi:hypothetical protein
MSAGGPSLFESDTGLERASRPAIAADRPARSPERDAEYTLVDASQGLALNKSPYCPIIPLHKRLPKAWRDPIKVPPAKSVVLGHFDAFDRGCSCAGCRFR